MERQPKCEGCGEVFADTSLLRVNFDGNYYCWRTIGEGGKPECIYTNPKYKREAPVAMGLTWLQLYSLTEYIDGNRDLEILEVIDTIKYAADRILYMKLKHSNILGYTDGIPKPYSESLDEGDAES